MSTDPTLNSAISPRKSVRERKRKLHFDELMMGNDKNSKKQPTKGGKGEKKGVKGGDGKKNLSPEKVGGGSKSIDNLDDQIRKLLEQKKLALLEKGLIKQDDDVDLTQKQVLQRKLE